MLFFFGVLTLALALAPAFLLLLRPDGIGHPLAESDHSESITPHVGVSHPPQPHSRRGLSDMVSLGLVQGCFKMYWGLFRVGLRVGLRFLQGFLIVCFRVYLGLT